MVWLAPAAVLACLLGVVPRAAAQSPKLAQMPPPPSEYAPLPSSGASSGAANGSSNGGGGSASAGESSSKADAGESSSRADDAESSSKGGPDDSFSPNDSLTPPNPSRPSLARRGKSESSAGGAASDPDQPAFDPLHADKSLDVGLFYFKKGQYDAAIDRYQEAAQENPKMAKPYLLLGEAYEKKNATAEALKAYRKYLDMFANAPDRAKVQERIDKLAGRAGHS